MGIKSGSVELIAVAGTTLVNETPNRLGYDYPENVYAQPSGASVWTGQTIPATPPYSFFACYWTFDFSSIPAGAVITRMRLQCHADSVVCDNVPPDARVWINRVPSVAWTTHPTTLLTTMLNPNISTPAILPVETSQYPTLPGGSQIYRLLFDYAYWLVYATGTYYIRFFNFQAYDPQYYPKMLVDYTIPATLANPYLYADGGLSLGILTGVERRDISVYASGGLDLSVEAGPIIQPRETSIYAGGGVGMAVRTGPMVITTSVFAAGGMSMTVYMPTAIETSIYAGGGLDLTIRRVIPVYVTDGLYAGGGLDMTIAPIAVGGTVYLSGVLEFDVTHTVEVVVMELPITDLTPVFDAAGDFLVTIGEEEGVGDVVFDAAGDFLVEVTVVEDLPFEVSLAVWVEGGVEVE